MTPSSGFCVQCGRPIDAYWAFCPSCGAGRVPADTAAARSPFEPNGDVIELLEAKRFTEAEAMLRARLKLAPNAAGLVLLADLVFKTGRIEESGELLDAAIALEPTDPRVLLRRAQYLAKLGFCQRALADVAVARRHIADSDVRLLVYSHELERSLQEQAKHSFVRNTALPGWLARLTHRTPAGAPDTV